MNTPFSPADSQSSSLGSITPIPSTLGSASSAVDVAGHEWIEFIIALVDNIGGDPVTALQLRIEYRDAVSNTWQPVTVEDIDLNTGVATQIPYLPLSPTLTGDDVWRIPVLVHGSEMRCRPYAVSGTPDAGSSVEISGYRR